MYDLLLELVRSVRKDLEAGEPSQAMRTLCGYEQQAHEMYEGWDIPDDYTAFCDINDLGPLMERELLPADDEDDDGDMSAAPRLLRAVGQLTESTRNILAVANEIVEFEEEIDRLLAENEKPENDCAE